MSLQDLYSHTYYQGRHAPGFIMDAGLVRLEKRFNSSVSQYCALGSKATLNLDCGMVGVLGR